MPAYEIEIILNRQLADCLSIPVFITDTTGNLIFYNEPAEIILGTSFEETGEMPVEAFSDGSRLRRGLRQLRGLGRGGRLGGGREFGDEGGEEVGGDGAPGGELGFQGVHQGHQLLHFGHDPALFGEGREGKL